MREAVEAAECPVCDRPYFEHNRDGLIGCLEEVLPEGDPLPPCVVTAERGAAYQQGYERGASHGAAAERENTTLRETLAAFDRYASTPPDNEYVGSPFESEVRAFLDAS